MSAPKIPLAKRFWEKVDKTGECWIWTASLITGGYGSVWNEGRTVPAHRVSFEMARGTIPPGMFLDHMCHRKRCVRPDHLQIVTTKENGENRLANANNGTGVRGVSKTRRGKYVATVYHHGRKHNAGSFTTLADAETAVIAKRNELFTNNILDWKKATR